MAPVDWGIAVPAPLSHVCMAAIWSRLNIPVSQVKRPAQIGTSPSRYHRAIVQREQWRPGWDNEGMDLDSLTPAGGGSLRREVTGPHRVPVATFTAPSAPDPDAIWHGGRTNDMTRDGSQGDPLGYQPGHGIEHEPTDQDERNSERTVRNIAAPHAVAGSMVRAALRGF